MSAGPRLIARIALFAALIYVLNWATSYLPNVKLIFFITFSAGLLWGAVAGMLVGCFGMGLWSLFNPYGPVGLPIMVAQVIGAAAGGLVGAAFDRLGWRYAGAVSLSVMLGIAAIFCSVFYYVPVTVVDAWVYQPFWPRFIAGLPWVFISIGSNIVIFPLLFGATRLLYERERRVR